MSLAPSDLRYLAEVAISAATEAGEMIAQTRPTRVEHKRSVGSLASQVVTEVDRRSEALILERLEATRERFELGLLTEERDDDRSRFLAEYFWCIDPLDGTLPFAEGVPGYAVSIALVARDGTPLIGVIHDPVEATVLHAVAGLGAFRDGRSWSTEETRRNDVLSVDLPSVDLHSVDLLSVYADRSFVAAHDHDAVVLGLGRIANELGLRDLQLHVGAGAVMNACRVLANPPACYLKFPAPAGGGSLWDFAATSCLFREVGAVATDVHGAALDLNRADSTFMNHRGVLFATDEELAERLRAFARARLDA